MGGAPTADKATVLRWIQEGVFRVEDGKVFKGDKELTQRENTRQRCDHGDPRVDLWHEGLRRSIHVSALVWMFHTGCVVPNGFEIHHWNEDINDNSWENLYCLHSMDHAKIHNLDTEDAEIPF